jgi:23S rRNA pseudouridine1911/1915/1917 synthase
MEGGERMGIVHRLDKDTSGVILIAKTEAALQDLQKQFKKRTTTKSYIALVEGHPNAQRGIIEAPIGRDPRQRKRMAVVHDGKVAKTGYQVIEKFRDHTLLHLDLYTGRTHQIRVHLAWLGHPVAGDTVYGLRKKRLLPGRLFLHAHEITIDLPSSGERVKFTAPLPVDLENILEKFRQYESM